MHKFFFVAVVAVLVFVAGGAAADPAGVLVLTDGTQLEVASASVEGKLVYVAFETGQMQAYPIEEVDLQASGLVPEAVVADTPKKKTRNIADARSPETGRSGATITDQDVSHVKPGVPVDEKAEEGEAATAVALAISKTKHQIAGNIVNYTGVVHNAGTETVSMITVTATAVDAAGVTIGKGSTSIAREVPPGKDIAFAVSFPFDGRIANILTSARATMANFNFTEKTVDPEAGDESN